MSIKVVAQIQFESDMKRVLVDNKAIGNYIYEENIFKWVDDYRELIIISPVSVEVYNLHPSQPQNKTKADVLVRLKRKRDGQTIRLYQYFQSNTIFILEELPNGTPSNYLMEYAIDH